MNDAVELSPKELSEVVGVVRLDGEAKDAPLQAEGSDGTAHGRNLPRLETQ